LLQGRARVFHESEYLNLVIIMKVDTAIDTYMKANTRKRMLATSGDVHTTGYVKNDTFEHGKGSIIFC
jgi:hypothetical protein